MINYYFVNNYSADAIIKLSKFNGISCYDIREFKNFTKYDVGNFDFQNDFYLIVNDFDSEINVIFKEIQKYMLFYKSSTVFNIISIIDSPVSIYLYDNIKNVNSVLNDIEVLRVLSSFCLSIIDKDRTFDFLLKPNIKSKDSTHLKVLNIPYEAYKNFIGSFYLLFKSKYENEVNIHFNFDFNILNHKRLDERFTLKEVVKYAYKIERDNYTDEELVKIAKKEKDKELDTLTSLFQQSFLDDSNRANINIINKEYYSYYNYNTYDFSDIFNIKNDDTTTKIISSKLHK